MIIARIYGGLGNQMFQYAAARAVALRSQSELKLDATFFEGSQRGEVFSSFRREFKLPEFNTYAAIASPEEIRKVREPYIGQRLHRRVLRRIVHAFVAPRSTVIHERSMNFDPSILDLPDGVYLDGYWQSVSYFSEYVDTIRADFSFQDQALEQYGVDYVQSVRRTSEPVVAIHVRRGDIAYSYEVLQQPAYSPGPPVSPQYLCRATRRFDKHATYLLFTESPEDVSWCRRHIPVRYLSVADGLSDMHDFSVMKACDHNIISNSTFSWWAAWLHDNDDKIVVAPEPWFRPEFAPHHRLRDLIPLRWHLEPLVA